MEAGSGAEPPLRVLVVDDEAELRTLLLALLADAGFTPESARDGDDALVRCAQDDFDVILLDLSMPHVDGRAVLEQLARGAVLGPTSVVVVTAHHAPATVVELLESGATDFVKKPFDPEELQARITVAGRAARHVRHLRRKNTELQRTASTDALTSLPNRAALQAFIDDAVADKRHPVVGIAILDLDDFKAVNDDYGHQAGDAALIEVARILTDNVRAGDLVGRWGGDELLLVCPGADIEQIAAAAQRLQQAVARGTAEPSDDGRALSLSAGWASGPGPSEQLLADADRMLYRHKTGRT
jgi:diguanylate cyclase (GGDEF)-like protein